MKKHTRMISILVVVCLLFAVPVSAETGAQTRGSAYFAAHNAFLSKVDSSTFEIWFDVTANATTMQILGVDSIEVDRSPDGETWTLIRTYDSDDYPQMLCANTGCHAGYITYRYATPGFYYRAYITFYAKNSSGSAKLFRYTTKLQM